MYLLLPFLQKLPISTSVGTSRVWAVAGLERAALCSFSSFLIQQLMLQRCSLDPGKREGANGLAEAWSGLGFAWLRSSLLFLSGNWGQRLPEFGAIGPGNLPTTRVCFCF